MWWIFMTALLCADPNIAGVVLGSIVASGATLTIFVLICMGVDKIKKKIKKWMP